MEQQSALNKVPSRIKYYLLEWKDKHMDDYLRKYGELRLHDLTSEQVLGLFLYATSKDTIILNAIVNQK